ncbi:MAG: efflux RND transporter periplasmic adaptor subunit [Bacteroidota bacterium]
MDPTFISDKPGKSPMGMDLIPVYEGEEEITGGPTISIDPVTVQNIGVQTAPAEKVNLYRAIRTVGHVDYNEETLSRVNIKFSGWIEKLHIDKTGQMVRRGQAMLEIYSPELVSTQEEYLLAVRNVKKLEGSTFSEVTESSRSLLESARRRLLYWDISEGQIKDLEEKGTISKTVTLFAPVKGVVIDKMAEEGMRVVPGMDLFRIADLTEIWVYAHIYEYEVPWVKVGQPAEMDLPYIPGRTFKGKVDYIYPYLDQKTRDIKVRLVFQNPDLELKPQMYVNVQLESRLGADVTAVPTEAVIRSGKRNIVFVARGGGKFEPRDVVLGPEGQGGLVQVLAGIQPGEEVVTSAQFLLDSESRLKEAIQKMLESRRSGQQAVEKPDSQHNH